MSRRILVVPAMMLLVILLGWLLAACGGTTENTVAPTTEQEEASSAVSGGRALLEERCNKCHNLERVELARKTKGEWNSTLQRMLESGAQLNQAEQEQLAQYLAETYPK